MLKVFSTPADPSDAVGKALETISDKGELVLLKTSPRRAADDSRNLKTRSRREIEDRFRRQSDY